MIKTFSMYRPVDETGVSGTGRVLDGIVWDDHSVTVCWLGKISSKTYYKSFKDFETLHIKSHPTNETLISWDNGDQYQYNGKKRMLGKLPEIYSKNDKRREE